MIDDDGTELRVAYQTQDSAEKEYTNRFYLSTHLITYQDVLPPVPSHAKHCFRLLPMQWSFLLLVRNAPEI